MERTDWIKWIGGFFVLLLLMMAGAYLLYPYLNEERHREVITAYQTTGLASEAWREEQEMNEELGLDVTESSVEEGSDRRQDLLERVDSLEEENSRLVAELESTLNEMERLQDEMASQNEFSDEEFSERIKSLLNLDEGDLTPIVNQMSNDQLLRLYFGGGTIQREKLLRSLDAERATELMTEVML